MRKLIKKYQHPAGSLQYNPKTYDAGSLQGVDISAKAPSAGKVEGNLWQLPSGKYLSRLQDGSFVDAEGKEYDVILPEYRSSFEGDNALGYLNFMSPTLHIGAATRANGFGDYLTRVWEGNNGIVTDKFAQEHPYLSMGANLAGDVITGSALYKGYQAFTRNPFRLYTFRPTGQPLTRAQELENRAAFLLAMKEGGFEFESVNKHPELKDAIESNFVNSPGNSERIVSTSSSRPELYAKWLNDRFDLGLSETRTALVKPANSFSDTRIAGYYNPVNGSVMSTANADGISGTFLHEGISHATDFPMGSNYLGPYGRSTIRRMFNLGPINWLSGLSKGAWLDLANLAPKVNIIDKAKAMIKQRTLSPLTKEGGARLWQEARSTTNEAREHILNSMRNKGIPEDLFDDIIDKMPNEALMEAMNRNGYGLIYNELFTKLNPQQQDQYIKKLKFAMKYLPATLPFVAGQSTNE